MIRPFVLIDLKGCALTSEEESYLRHASVAGVVLFARNYDNPEQLLALTCAIKSIRPDLVIAIDQEGGRVQRLKDPFTLIPPMGQFGQWYRESAEETLQLLRDTAWLIGAELKAMHIDINFSPILDRDLGISQVIGDRAFDSDPALIALLGEQMIRGLEDAGVLAVGKHFPGHGAVVPDSHKELPIDPRAYDEIVDTDMRPFQRLISTNCLPAIMMSHVVYRQVDDKPAGFSSKWTSDILRNQLNYNGIIFTDDLSMEAARCFGDLLSTIDQSIASGADIVLVCNYKQDLDVGGLLDTLGELSQYAKDQLRPNIDLQRYSTTPLSWEQLIKDSRYLSIKQALHKRRV